MNNYVAIVFDNDTKAFDGLHMLWHLDDVGDSTVHGAAVIHRDAHGYVNVATNHIDTGARTAFGVGIGALVGALAGPAAFESSFVLARGQAAVIAEVSEEWTTPLDTAMGRIGGAVFRRPKRAVVSDAFSDDYFADHLYPYDYQPRFN